MVARRGTEAVVEGKDTPGKKEERKEVPTESLLKQCNSLWVWRNPGKPQNILEST